MKRIPSIIKRRPETPEKKDLDSMIVYKSLKESGLMD